MGGQIIRDEGIFRMYGPDAIHDLKRIPDIHGGTCGCRLCDFIRKEAAALERRRGILIKYDISPKLLDENEV